MKKGLAVLCMVFTVCFAAYADIVVESNSAVEGGAGRFALLIGNSKYQEPMGILRTPAQDTEDIAAALAALGYRVTVRLDADLAGISLALDEFAAFLSGNPGNEGFFWFAGQGAEINGENYLLPVDIKLEANMAASAYSVEMLLYRLNGAGNTANVVMLDACFERILSSGAHRGIAPDTASEQSGLTGIARMSGDIFYMQSAWPGRPAADSVAGGRNSPFAAAFLETINKDEPLALLAADIIRETAAKTLGWQKPYCLAYLLRDKNYRLYRGITR
jgi:hypothetical protein